MPGRPTPRKLRRSAGAVAGFLLLGGPLLVGTTVALAPAALAADDPARPDFAVTDGPSCHPGGVQVRVVAGTVAYRVVLATTREPDGEDSADLEPGQAATLATGDVAYGETVDSRLVFTALDGSGTTYADELVPYSFTRPSEADCAAIAATLGETAELPPSPLPGGQGAPGELPASPGVALPDEGSEVQEAAVEMPAAPVTRTPDWALITAAGALTGTAAWLGTAAVRRRSRTAHAGRAAAAQGTMGG